MIATTLSRQLFDRITGRPGACWIVFEDPSPEDMAKKAECQPDEAKAANPKEDLSGPNDAIGYGVWWHAPTYRYRPNVVEQPTAPTRDDDDDVLR